jgi:hypothetical protein
LATRILRYLSLIIVLAVALAWGLSRGPAHEGRDVVQERLEHATPPLTAESSIGQTFLSRHNGLKAVELLVVVYDSETPRPPSARLLFTLEALSPDAAMEPIHLEHMAAGLEHNQKLRFAFDPLSNSRDVTYRLTLRSESVGPNADHGIGFWYSASEAYAYGARLEDGVEQPGDLHLVTFYDYTPAAVLADALRLLGETASLLPTLAILLLLPGFLLWRLARPPLGSPIDGVVSSVVSLAWMVALSLAAWPVLLLWTTMLGLRVLAPQLWGIVALLAVLAALTVWRQRWAQRRGLTLPSLPRDDDLLPEITLAVILLVAWATRLLQIRDLVLPAWVDSVHHTLIVQLIAEAGQVPDSLHPYLPIDGFHYHWGFHAVAAFLHLLSGVSTARAVLIYGQVLNVLAGLSAYVLAVAWTPAPSGDSDRRRRWAGVGAALVVLLLSYMPAYYVSWGRYTQLAGMILLPFAVLATSSWLMRPTLAEEGHTRAGLLVLTALLVAGLGLIHYRVIVLYLLYGPLLILWFLVRRRMARSAWRELFGAGVLLAVVSGLLLAPWLARFVIRVFPAVGATYGGMAANEAMDTSFSTSLLRVGWTPWLLYLSAAGLVWGLVRRRIEILILGVWVGLWLLVANLSWLGLPNLWLIHNQSVIIAYWLPVGVLCGWLAADFPYWMAQQVGRLWRRWNQHELRWEPVLSWVLAAAMLILAGVGAWRRVNAVNPVTVLATAEDVQAIQWVAENLPEDALVLINSGRWQGELRSGTDGGWWLPILARRQVTLPSVLYAQGSPDYFLAVNDLARTVEEAAAVDDPELLHALEEAGVTHVFVGARGGKLMPQELDASPHYRSLYVLGPVRVYAFEPPGAAP